MNSIGIARHQKQADAVRVIALTGSACGDNQHIGRIARNDDGLVAVQLLARARLLCGGIDVTLAVAAGEFCNFRLHPRHNFIDCNKPITAEIRPAGFQGIQKCPRKNAISAAATVFYLKGLFIAGAGGDDGSAAVPAEGCNQLLIGVITSGGRLKTQTGITAIEYEQQMIRFDFATPGLKGAHLQHLIAGIIPRAGF